jgi:hypothetical protein
VNAEMVGVFSLQCGDMGNDFYLFNLTDAAPLEADLMYLAFSARSTLVQTCVRKNKQSEQLSYHESAVTVGDLV